MIKPWNGKDIRLYSILHIMIRRTIIHLITSFSLCSLYFDFFTLMYENGFMLEFGSFLIPPFHVISIFLSNNMQCICNFYNILNSAQLQLLASHTYIENNSYSTIWMQAALTWFWKQPLDVRNQFKNYSIYVEWRMMTL